jgi:hypothetical protein
LIFKWPCSSKTAPTLTLLQLTLVQEHQVMPLLLVTLIKRERCVSKYSTHAMTVTIKRHPHLFFSTMINNFWSLAVMHYRNTLNLLRMVRRPSSSKTIKCTYCICTQWQNQWMVGRCHSCPSSNIHFALLVSKL